MVDRLVNRLGKVIALMDGATTDGEAQAALAKATDLLEGTGLTLEEFREQYGAEADAAPETIEIKVVNSTIFIPGVKLLRWKTSAARAACAATGCRIVYRQGGETRIADELYIGLVCVGTEDALSMAAGLLRSLMTHAFPAALETYKREPEYQAASTRGRRLLGGDFSIAFWGTLEERAESARRTREAMGRKRLTNRTRGLIGHGEACTALVLATDTIRERTLELMRVEEAKVRAGKTLRGGGTYTSRARSRSAYEAGQAAARNVSLTAGGGRGTRQIGQ